MTRLTKGMISEGGNDSGFPKLDFLFAAQNFNYVFF